MIEMQSSIPTLMVYCLLHTRSSSLAPWQTIEVLRRVSIIHGQFALNVCAKNQMSAAREEQVTIEELPLVAVHTRMGLSGISVH
jgi:hypothetical protein